MNKGVSPGLKILFILSLFGASLVAAIVGLMTFEDAPPYPEKAVSSQGKIITTKDRILNGQSTFQEYGLMDLGSVWGNGTYRGADFTAEALHLEGGLIRDFFAQQKFRRSYAGLSEEDKASVDRLTINDIKQNRYDPATGVLSLSDAQVYALEQIRGYYDGLFSQGDSNKLINKGTIKDAAKRQDLADFFFWTAWAAGTLRPGADHTYTNNWPGDRSIGNDLSKQAALWSVISIMAFLTFLGIIVWLFHRMGFNREEAPQPELVNSLIEAPVSLSQIKSAKYFLVAITLFLLQTLMGGYMAHQTVNPGTFYGLDWITELIPYNWAKSWHLQLAIFWVATGWIGSALYLAPMIGNREPRKQGLLVDILFVAVVIVALGSLTGEVLGLKGQIGGKLWFWLGHQGWEYLELGRLWQILLLAGLVIWLFIVARAVKDRLSAGANRWDLPHFYVYSAIVIVAFFAFGLFYDNMTNLTIADFWRWWVVHTWVEGAFEFFTVAALALITVRIGLVEKQSALRAAYLTASLALATGIIGVGHHYYWFGEPSVWMALGTTISALEPVPILLLLGEAWKTSRATREKGIDFPYYWPLRFLTASAIWSFIGAGIFGFTVTLPIINYFEHGTYLTVTHGHTALFGTYGMLSIGLMLFAYRGLVKEKAWQERASLLKTSFWSINLGLAVMFLFTLLPVGILQFVASYTEGMWFARSPAFYNQEIIRWFGEVRMIPDLTIVALGVVPLLLFIVTTITRLKPVGVKEDEQIIVAAGSKGMSL